MKSSLISALLGRMALASEEGTCEHGSCSLDELSMLQTQLMKHKFEVMDQQAPPANYVGCFADDGDRDLQQGPRQYGYTTETCGVECASFQYFALQHNGWCACGDAYSTAGPYRQTDDSDCGGPCAGQTAGRCGGGWRNAVYEVRGGIHEELDEALGEHGRQIEELHSQQLFTDDRIKEVEEQFNHALETLHSMGVEALADQDGRIQANADDIAQLEAALGQSLAELHQMGVEALQAQGGRIDGLAEHVLLLEEQFGNALEELHAMGLEAFAEQGARVDELEGAMEGMHQSQAERITHMEETFHVALADMHNLGDVALSEVQDQIDNLGAMHDITNDRIDDLEERVEALESAGQPPVDLPVGQHGVFNNWAATAGVHLLSGDFNGDGHTDVALLGGPGWGSIPVAFSRGNGAYSVTNCAVPNMNAWEDSAGARPLVGDFDGDGKDDIALTGGHGWGSLPVAFSTENGCFTVTNHGLASFPGWAATANVQVIAGDFDGDGKADVAAIGNAGWGSLPTAFSNGDGTFRVTNHAMSSGGNARHFNAWSSRSGVHVLAGDFNGDGKDDVALIGGPGWASVPVAVSAGDGTYNSVSNCHVHAMNSWIDSAGARPLVADFNGDGKDDIALTGGSGWNTIPVAASTSAGCFAVSNSGVTSFPGWAASANVQVVAGDFNSDGHGDIAAIGHSGWGSLPTAFGTSTGDGTFSVTNHGI